MIHSTVNSTSDGWKVGSNTAFRERDREGKETIFAGFLVEKYNKLNLKTINSKSEPENELYEKQARSLYSN